MLYTLLVLYTCFTLGLRKVCRKVRAKSVNSIREVFRKTIGPFRYGQIRLFQCDAVWHPQAELRMIAWAGTFNQPGRLLIS